ncbi:LptF/LptG family permease [Novosphingobium aquae]|uniref:LptF/LptG family permease n=1 Tax=Novosphingobium aquae TaxID=3133435 RepID=A0ABU8S773_9SPHN
MPVRLIDRYLFRAGARSFLTYLVLLFAVVLLERSIRLLQQMELLGLGSAHLVPLIVAMVPFSLSLAIPVTFGMAMVVVFDQLTRQREVECLFGQGWPAWRIAMPFGALGLALCATSLFVSGWVEPLGRHLYREKMALAKHRLDEVSIRPDAIHEVGRVIMMTAGRAAENNLEQVLVWSRGEDGTEIIAAAKRGVLHAQKGSDWLALNLRDGRLIADRPGASHVTIAPAFDSLTISASQGVGAQPWPRGRDALESTLPELLATSSTAKDETVRRKAVAETWRRLARALAIPLIPFLVLPLIAANTPGRRGPAVFVIAAIMIAGHHGINLAYGMGVEGAVSPERPLQLLLLGQVLLVALIWVLGRNIPGQTPLGMLSHLHIRRKARPRGQPRARILGTAVLPMIYRLLAGRVLGFSLAILLFMTLLLELIDVLEAGDVLIASGTGTGGLARYLVLRAPQTIVRALPLAALAGPLLAFLTLRDSRELLIVQTLGLSAFKVLRVTSLSAAMLAILGFIIAESLVPFSEAAFSRWWRTVERAAGEKLVDKPAWLRIDGRIVRFEAASADGTQLQKLLILTRDNEGGLTSVLRAASATRQSSGWSLLRPEEHDILRATPPQQRSRQDWKTSLTPADVRRIVEQGPPENSRLSARILAGSAAASRARAYYATRLAYRWAFPVMPFIMLLLAMPVVFASQQPRKIASSVAMTSTAGLLFMFIDGVMRIMGSVGEVPSVLAVWSAPVLFALIGLHALLRSEKVA